MVKLWQLFIVLSLIINFNVHSAIYVREGANGNGASWSNAYGDLPETLTRGDTVWIADGNYSGYTFNDVNLGSEFIYIMKATQNKHGTEIGWNSGYGDGTATFNGTFTFSTDYYWIDGKTRAFDDTSGYGFKVGPFGLSANAKCFNMSGARHDIKLRYIEAEHRGRDQNASDDIIYGTSSCYNIDIQYCYWHDCSRVHFLTRQWHDIFVEYSIFKRNSDNEAIHSELWSDNGSDNIVFRFNEVVDIEGTGCFVQINGVDTAWNWHIYGNVFRNTDGFINDLAREFNYIINVNFDGPTQQIIAMNWKFYNNTLYRIQSNGSADYSGINFDRAGAGNESFNNIWYDCDQLNSSNINSSSNNVFYNTKYNTIEENVQILNNNIFIEAPYNLRLKQSTSPGLVLEAPFNQDKDSNIRGKDGIWDRGAFEFDDEHVNFPPDISRNLRIKNE